MCPPPYTHVTDPIGALDDFALTKVLDAQRSDEWGCFRCNLNGTADSGEEEVKTSSEGEGRVFAYVGMSYARVRA